MSSWEAGIEGELLGLAVAGLSLTGIAIWLRKRRARVRSGQRSGQPGTEVQGAL